MIYRVGMYAKHYKGESLLDKNIYQIEELLVRGKDISSEVTYTGKGTLENADNLVVYANIFQNNKLFAREYDDLARELTFEEQRMFGQTHMVEPLNQEEIKIIMSPEFREEKLRRTEEKFKTR